MGQRSLSLLSVAAAVLSASAAFAAKAGRPGCLKSELAGMLSAGAELFVPSDADYGNASVRWSTFDEPTFRAYVEVATEKDVQETIRFANSHNLPFLAVSGGHGWSSKLGGVQGGIGISTAKLNATEISKDGRTARLGGGTKSGAVEKFLTANGKRSTTGVCECTGMAGVALSGGHGTLQGYYGLLVDQIVGARVVLADGSIVTASETENSDLLWALKGAGQNFGVVTELTYKIYDAPAEDNWIVKTFIYTPDKISDFYTQLNNFTSDGEDWEAQPAGLLLASLYTMETAIDPDAPVLVFLMVYDGTEEELEPMAAPFYAVGPVYNVTETVSYSEISAVFGYDDSAALCEKGWRTQQYSLLIQNYDVAAQVEAYNIYSTFIESSPQFNHSYLIFEGYPQQQVRDIDSSTAAVAHRDRNIIVLFSAIYWDAEHDAATSQVGEKVRSLLYNGTGEADLSVYVGYANGDESVQQLFGSDRSKIEKLVNLKQQYDPKERFRFYAPLVQ